VVRGVDSLLFRRLPTGSRVHLHHGSEGGGTFTALPAHRLVRVVIARRCRTRRHRLGSNGVRWAHCGRSTRNRRRWPHGL
jgi:hypothetical protein